MSKEYILMISEGDIVEKDIINNIKNNFFNKNDLEIVFLSFKCHIYALWKALKEDNFETDLFEIVKEKNPGQNLKFSDLTRESVSEIYLFFDYDGHAQRNDGFDDTTIGEMLKVFDNETGHGKLYISYPMVEALKDMKIEEPCANWCKFPISSGKKYKKHVGERSEFRYLKSLTVEDWNYLIKNNINKVNCICVEKGEFSTPNYSTYMEKCTPIHVFDKQRTEFINIDDTIAILSAFPFFLIDYFGKEFYEVKAYVDVSSSDGKKTFYKEGGLDKTEDKTVSQNLDGMRAIEIKN